jgi:hypothetical protein
MQECCSRSEILKCDVHCHVNCDAMRPDIYRGADKSLARPGRKQVTAAEDFVFHVSYL